MLKTILKHAGCSNKHDLMQKFEIYVADNSFEISLLLSLSHHKCVSIHIKQSWLNTFHALSRSLKIDSLHNIISIDSNNSTKTKKDIIIPNYNQYSHFIQNDLIPMIIDYEITNDDLISEIYSLYKRKLHQYFHRLNFYISTFHIFGWTELVLFLFLNISHFISLLCFDIFKSYHHIHHFIKLTIAPILLFVFIIHLSSAIKTFHKRRLFCYYLQCLSSEINSESYIFTPYILEGFNIPNLSSFHNQDYTQNIGIISPNFITMYTLVIFSLKYIIGIVYCLCNINIYIGAISIFLLPITIGTSMNIDSIHQKLNKSIYKNVLNLYKSS